MNEGAVELPVLPSEPACPAALVLRGASGCQQGVICRAMQQDVERDDGTELGMSAARYGFLQHEASAGVHLTLFSDPGTVVGFCHGRALPVLTDDDDPALARASYTRCPVWQAEKERIAAGRDGLVVECQPDPVGTDENGEPVMFMPASADAPDPWAAAREGLDVLAGVS